MTPSLLLWQLRRMFLLSVTHVSDAERPGKNLKRKQELLEPSLPGTDSRSSTATTGQSFRNQCLRWLFQLETPKPENNRSDPKVTQSDPKATKSDSNVGSVWSLTLESPLSHFPVDHKKPLLSHFTCFGVWGL